MSKSKEQINRYFDYAESLDPSVHKRIRLCGSYSLKRDTKKALEQMKIDSQLDYFGYGFIPNFIDDPMFDNIREHPNFKKLLSEMEDKFWENHERVKANLKEKGLL